MVFGNACLLKGQMDLHPASDRKDRTSDVLGHVQRYCVKDQVAVAVVDGLVGPWALLTWVLVALVEAPSVGVALVGDQSSEGGNRHLWIRGLGRLRPYRLGRRTPALYSRIQSRTNKALKTGKGGK